MAWGILIAAGGLEVFWATFMKLSEGFTKPLYIVLTFAGMAASFLLLARATRTLPLGTAYAVWTGIGALGALIVGVLLFRESLTPRAAPLCGAAAHRHHRPEGHRMKKGRPLPRQGASFFTVSARPAPPGRPGRQRQTGSRAFR